MMAYLLNILKSIYLNDYENRVNNIKGNTIFVFV